jgi:hypothetical protein
MMRRLLLICLFAVVMPVAHCLAQQQPATTTATGQTPSTVNRSAPPVAQPEENCGCESQVLPEVLATVNGVRITNKEIDPATKERVAGLQRQVIEARKRELDLQINSKLLQAEAKKRGLTPTKLLEAEVLAKVKEPTEAEAQAFYDENKSRIQNEFKDTKADIISYLRDRGQREEAAKFAGRLRAAAQVKVLVQNVVPPQTQAERTRVLATVNGESITSGDIEDSLQPLIYNVQEQVYNLRKRELDLRINDTLLEQEAQKRKVTTSALLETEVNAKVKQTTEQDARAFYDQNKAKLNGEFTNLKEQIIRYLQEREIRNAQLAYADQLRRSASTQMMLVQPKPPATAPPPSSGSAAPPR